jgi:hemerythrin-like metal-binding protein
LQVQMTYLATGHGPLDRAHRDLDRCLRDLRVAILARDAHELRGRSCLVVEKLAEHFADEEDLMRSAGWPQLAAHVGHHARLLAHARRFEQEVVTRGVTHHVASWALARLPEMLRFHMVTSDYGFGVWMETQRRAASRRH